MIPKLESPLGKIFRWQDDTPYGKIFKWLDREGRYLPGGWTEERLKTIESQIVRKRG